MLPKSEYVSFPRLPHWQFLSRNLTTLMDFLTDTLMMKCTPFVRMACVEETFAIPTPSLSQSWVCHHPHDSHRNWHIIAVPEQI